MPRRTMEGHERSLTHVVYSGDVLASASRDKTVRLWSLTNYSQPAAVFEGHDMAVMGLAMNNGERECERCMHALTRKPIIYFTCILILCIHAHTPEHFYSRICKYARTTYMCTQHHSLSHSPWRPRKHCHGNWIAEL